MDSKDYFSVIELYFSLGKIESVVEKLIILGEQMCLLHPSSVKTIRMSQLITKDGDIVVFLSDVAGWST